MLTIIVFIDHVNNYCIYIYVNPLMYTVQCTLYTFININSNVQCHKPQPFHKLLKTAKFEYHT